MKISIIAALASNRAIGADGKLIYWLPDDLKRFKSLTTGHTILMGRRTFDSLPKGALPNRRNVVLSRSLHSLPGAEVFVGIDEALASCGSEEDVFVIGGASVYAQALPLADRLCLTLVHDAPEEADAFFPAFDGDEWREVHREDHGADERHSHAYSFVDYVRK